MKNRFWIKLFAVLGVIILLTTACKKKDEEPKDLAIGDDYGGGKAAYIFQSGDPGYVSGEVHGLIAASNDFSATAAWGCYGTAINGADGTGLGTGSQNTTDIVNGCTTSGIAAKLCYDYVVDDYSDWFLPSKDELNKLYLAKDLIGGFTTTEYWSSSENAGNETDQAWYQSLSNGLQYNYGGKGAKFYVRAVRTF